MGGYGGIKNPYTQYVRIANPHEQETVGRLNLRDYNRVLAQYQSMKIAATHKNYEL